MKVFFSSSQSKNVDRLSSSKQFENRFRSKELLYKNYLNLIETLDDHNLTKLLGTKDIKSLKSYKENILNSSFEKAILRYSGVAYKVLQYSNLNSQAQEFINKNVIIFSDLFGAISADEKIPYYKIKQGAKLDKIDITNFCSQNFSKFLDEEFLNEEILDLRASFYEKFYEIKQKYISMKFLKNGKNLSHFAKFYRGEVLREIATHNIDSFTKLSKHNFENLSILEIKEIKNRLEFIYKVD